MREENFRILVVDDDANVARVISLLLEDDGHEVTVAANLAEARDRAYAGVDRISWPGMHYRKDIGLRGRT